MATVLKYEQVAELPAGTHVWEECMWGSDPCEMVKTRTDNTNGRLRVYGTYAGEEGELRFSRDFDFRYWDSRPDDLERQETRWSRSRGS